jgi:copper resistance protein D
MDVMGWLQVVNQWTHVFFAIFWFGGTLYADFILIPALNPLPLGVQRQVGAALGVRANRVIPVVAGLTILLGIIRGTVFGPIKGANDLTTAYGLTWLFALVVAIATFMFGFRVISPALDRLNAIPESDATLADGRPSPKLAALLDDVKRKVGLELLGFVVIFTAMILLRFGL